MVGRTDLLTLLSDFGLSDVYVGVMKGVIAQINPCITVVDLTHAIPPQNIAIARFALATAFPHFPTGTVHVAVVDPGVGSDRRSIAVAVGTNPAKPMGFLVGPDNGVFGGVLAQSPVMAAIELTNSDYWRTSSPSATFHGRDVFAAVGAHLASGVSLQTMGTAIAPESLVSFNLPYQTQKLGDRSITITGCIQAWDHFGNLITNIPAAQVSGKNWFVLIETLKLLGKTTYSSSSVGELLAVVGSHGWVEIAVNSGNAQAKLGLGLGHRVQVVTD